MKKKELLSMPLRRATSQMFKIAISDVAQKKDGELVYSYYDFFSAEVIDNILKVSIYKRDKLIKGNYAPYFVVFIDKTNKKWLTYEVSQNAWRTARICNLTYDYNQPWYIYSGVWQSENTKKLINAYLETGVNFNAREAIQHYQAEIGNVRLQDSYNREINMIDAVMNEVPDLPKDFEKWVLKNAFLKKEYLMYQKGKFGELEKTYCTHCHTESFAGHKPAHNELTICPNCKIKVIWKSWNKQKYLGAENNVVIVQRLKDDTCYIIRKFHCRVRRRQVNGNWINTELDMNEIQRETLTEHFLLKSKYYYMDMYRSSNIYRWCSGKSNANRSGYYGYYGYNMEIGSGVCYTSNLKCLFRKESFGKVNFKKLLKGNTGSSVWVDQMLPIIANYPQIEYLQKTGLNTLSEEILAKKEDKTLFVREAKKINEYVGLDKQYFEIFKKADGGSRLLKAMQYVCQKHEKLSEENIEWIKENNVKIDKLGLDRTGLTLERAINFVKKISKMHDFTAEQTLNYYIDYLDMAANRGMDIRDEIVSKNARMMEFHNVYLEELNAKGNIKRDLEVDRKFKNIALNYNRNQEHFEWNYKDIAVIVPSKAAQITKEGRLQHHCVGASDTYISKMDTDKSYILFLRHIKNIEIPYYTLEVRWNGEIIQAYAAYDRKPNWQQVEKILKAWTKEIKERIKNDELAIGLTTAV